MEAINLAGSTVGVLAEVLNQSCCNVFFFAKACEKCQDGVVLAGEKKTTSKLLDQAKQHEKLFQPLGGSEAVLLNLPGCSSSVQCCLSPGWTTLCSVCASYARLSPTRGSASLRSKLAPASQVVLLSCQLLQVQWLASLPMRRDLKAGNSSSTISAFRACTRRS